MKTSILLCFSALLLCITHSSQAQNTFLKLYGGPEDDWFEMAIPAGDGNYMTLFNSGDVWDGPISIGLVKFDDSGDILWTKLYNNLIDETAYSLQKTPANEFVVSGSGKYCISFNCGTDGFVFKTDASGTVNFSRGLGETSFDWGNRAIQTSDGGYCIAMETSSIGSGGVMAVMRLNSSGDTLWTRSYQDEGTNGAGGQSCQVVIETSDGGFLLGGNFRLNSVSQFHTYVVKLNSSGAMVWSKAYVDTGFNFTEVYDLIEMANGDIAILTRSSVIRTDNAGDILWAKSYPGYVARYGQEGYASFSETSDGGFILAGGYIESAETNPAIVKLSSSGTVEWVEEYYSGYGGAAFSAVQLSNGYYLISGMITEIGSGGLDGFVGVTDVQGGIYGCSTTKSITATTANITVNSVTPTINAGLRSVVNNYSEQTPGGGLVETFSCIPAVGMEEASQQTISIFPNPASDQVRVVLDTPEIITLYNILGKQVMTVTAQNNTTILEVSHLPSGLYDLKVGGQVEKLVIE